MTSIKLNKYQRILRKIKKVLPDYQALTDEKLKAQTQVLRARIKSGELTEKILPDAFSTIIEADRRVLGMELYDVQILGGIALFFGNIAEMKTGEGKTLTATLPMYLRALMGQGNFVVTTNAYLAHRDAEEMGEVYRWLGLSVAVAVPKDETEEIDKKEVYSADIIYTTHSSLGFDYLFDNLALDREHQYLPEFNYVIIDEVDSILLDMAQTPLIVSGAPKAQSNLFFVADEFVKTLRNNIDYEKSEDRRYVWFLAEGIRQAEVYFDVENLLSKENTALYRHLVLALKANHVMRRNRDYVVEEDEIFLLDEMNGRKLLGTKLQAGYHQAIEAKEGVTITPETRAMGTISYQNLFKKFKLLSGMTGTAKEDQEEFRQTYHVDVLSIPTHHPIIRQDHQDSIYFTQKEKLLKTVEMVKEAFAQQRPVLISTGSVSKSELYSLLLLRERIPHHVLNATTEAKEVEIVAESGKKGAVTVATSMAGRGTDIKLDDFSRSKGGMLVIGTERMTSERIDNQLRGRAGRQGDPGDSYFFSSLEDRIVVENGPKWIRSDQFREKNAEIFLHDEDKGKLKSKKYRRILALAQKNKKNEEVASRKNALEYDDVISVMREEVYQTRNSIISGNLDDFKGIIQKAVKESIKSFVSEPAHLEGRKLLDFIFNNIDYNFDGAVLEEKIDLDKKSGTRLLSEVIEKRFEEIKESISDDFQREYYYRMIILRALDQLWIELADGLVQLKAVVVNRAWGQHHPLYEFQLEANRYFLETKEKLWLDIVRHLLLSERFYNEDGSIDIEFP